MPVYGPRPKFEVSFFNDDKLAYVSSNGLFDFISDFEKCAPKRLTNVRISIYNNFRVQETTPYVRLSAS